MSNVSIFSAAFGIAMVLAAAPAAALSTLNVETAGIYNSAPISSVGVPTINTSGGNFRITGTSDTGSFDFDAFCVDLARNISVGTGVQANVNYNYQVGTFTTDGFGNLLSADQVKQAKGLATLGFSLVGDPTKGDDLAAIQGAIWQVLHPDAVFSSSNAAVDALIGSYVTLAPSLTGNARFIFSTDGDPQQSLLIPGVPEPATWAMLIAGFGMVGFALRNRRGMVGISARRRNRQVARATA